MSKFFAGVDVGKTNIRVGITGQEPRLKYYKKRPYNCSTPAQLEECIITALDDAIQEGDFSRSSLAGIGLGIPAIVDRSTGAVLYGPAFDFMDGYSITRPVIAHYNIPVVADVDPVIATWGENWAGIGRQCMNFAVITWGTGIGAGLVIDGDVLERSNNLFPEFGHSIVSDDGWPCICGANGCINALASGPGIAKHGQLALQEGRQTILAEMAGGISGEVTSPMIFEAAERGDKIALSILERVGVLLGRLCVNLVYTLQPEKIVIVGGLSERKEWVLDTMRKTLEKNCWLILRGFTKCRIVVSELGDTAGVLGAIRKVQVKIKKEIGYADKS